MGTQTSKIFKFYLAPPPDHIENFKKGGFFSKRIGAMVLPAAGSLFGFKDPAKKKELAQYIQKVTAQIPDYNKTAQSALATHKVEVNTHDGATLDTFEIVHQDEPPEKRKYIIYFCGNMQAYEEQAYNMRNLAKSGYNVVGFNYRGVANSTGTASTADDLVIDGIAQVQRLLDMGVPAENITLRGHSLGGAIATKVTEHFHRIAKKPQRISVLNCFSFSTLSTVPLNFLRNYGVLGTIATIVLYPLAYPLIKLGLYLSNWEINAATSYKHIDPAYKHHIRAKNDGIIHESASLDSALPQEARTSSVFQARTKEAIQKAYPSFSEEELRNIANTSVHNLEYDLMTTGEKTGETHVQDTIKALQQAAAAKQILTHEAVNTTHSAGMTIDLNRHTHGGGSLLADAKSPQKTSPSKNPSAPKHTSHSDTHP